jgi:hypothetical protein
LPSLGDLEIGVRVEIPDSMSSRLLVPLLSALCWQKEKDHLNDHLNEAVPAIFFVT